MNLRNEKFSTLMAWKTDKNLPSIFVSEVVKELKKRQSSINKLSEKEKIKLATDLVKKGVAVGGETVEDVEIAMKILGLPKTKDNFCSIYKRVYGHEDIWDSLSESFKKKFKK